MNHVTPLYTITDAAPQASDVVGFSALSVLTGKGVTALDKARNHVANGAAPGALIAAGVTRKALIETLTQGDVNATAHALASGNIRPAAALVVAKCGKAVSLMEVNGKAPYSEWLRMGATLRGMVQTTKGGKPTNAAKGLQLWTQYHEQAALIRADREAQKMLGDAGLSDAAPDAGPLPTVDGVSDAAPVADAGILGYGAADTVEFPVLETE